MLEREQFILAVCAATLLMVVGIFILLWRRHLRKSELEILLEAVGETRDQVDSHGRHTALEHQALTKLIEKANGRLQFLIAKDIADELAAQRRREETPTLKPDDDT